MSTDSLEADNLDQLFTEPADFGTEDSTPTYLNYERQNPPADEPAELTLRLVAKSPLWGHLLWNAGRVSAQWIEQNRDYIKDRTVLELGAAAAVPSLLASLVARNVVITDYPDPNLIQNIQYNIDLVKKSCPAKNLSLTAKGYIWGQDPQELFDCEGQNGEKFDLIIMSDLVFNHSEHTRLVETGLKCLKPDGKILVMFSPHRPRLYHKDLEFFDLAKEKGFDVEQIIEKRLNPMFEEDEETKELRSMVFGYILTFA